MLKMQSNKLCIPPDKIIYAHFASHLPIISTSNHQLHTNLHKFAKALQVHNKHFQFTNFVRTLNKSCKLSENFSASRCTAKHRQTFKAFSISSTVLHQSERSFLFLICSPFNWRSLCCNMIVYATKCNNFPASA